MTRRTRRRGVKAGHEEAHAVMAAAPEDVVHEGAAREEGAEGRLVQGRESGKDGWEADEQGRTKGRGGGRVGRRGGGGGRRWWGGGR